MVRNVTLISALILVLAVVGFAQMPGVALMPVTDKPVYTVDEPIQLTIFNQSKSRYYFCNMCLLETSFQVFDDFGGREMWWPFSCTMNCDDGQKYPLELKSGQSISRTWYQHAPPGLYHFGVNGLPPYADFVIIDRMTLDEAKSLPDGEFTTVVPCVITHVEPDFFYIENEEGTIGIMVFMPNHGFDVGTRIEVDGVLGTTENMERFISANNVQVLGIGKSEPTTIEVNKLGGTDWYYDPNTGAGQVGVSGGSGDNNIGLQVSLTGTIIEGAEGSSDILVGNGDDTPIEVVLPTDVTSPGTGAKVTVIGAVSIIKEHQQITGPTKPTYQDFLRVKILANSIDTVSEAGEWKYGGDMITIAAGDFLMGNSGVGSDSSYDKIGVCENEKPQHSVFLGDFDIGKNLVTRGEFKKFVEAGGYSDSANWSKAGWKWKTDQSASEPRYWKAVQKWGSDPGPFTQTDDHPVVGVSYYEAEAYCKWAGGHLPTEAEWEKAARWNKDHPYVYPWGDKWDSEMCKNQSDTLYPGYQTAPVGSYEEGASPYGVLDMAGNTWEWVADIYQADYYKKAPDGGWIAPKGPVTGDKNILRGGGWMTGTDLTTRAAYRRAQSPTALPKAGIEIGFRIAR